MKRLFRTDVPFASSLVVLATLTLGGFGGFALGWWGTARQAAVTRQLPFLVSSGLGGVALLGCALALLVVQTRRWTEARERAGLARLAQALGELRDVTQARGLRFELGEDGR